MSRKRTRKKPVNASAGCRTLVALGSLGTGLHARDPQDPGALCRVGGLVGRESGAGARDRGRHRRGQLEAVAAPAERPVHASAPRRPGSHPRPRREKCRTPERACGRIGGA